MSEVRKKVAIVVTFSCGPDPFFFFFNLEMKPNVIDFLSPAFLSGLQACPYVRTSEPHVLSYSVHTMHETGVRDEANT